MFLQPVYTSADFSSAVRTHCCTTILRRIHWLNNSSIYKLTGIKFKVINMAGLCQQKPSTNRKFPMMPTIVFKNSAWYDLLILPHPCMPFTFSSCSIRGVEQKSSQIILWDIPKSQLILLTNFRIQIYDKDFCQRLLQPWFWMCHVSKSLQSALMKNKEQCFFLKCPTVCPDKKPMNQKYKTKNPGCYELFGWLGPW